MKLALLLPVKDLTEAKTRLAPLLNPAERRELAMVMLQGVLEASSRLEGLARRVMVTNYPPAMELARAAGFEVLPEEGQHSESQSVDWASGLLEGEGITGVLRVPLDLPLVDVSELEQVLELGKAGERVVLVPSLAGTGTNAVFRASPTLFPSRFGPGSLELHKALARQQGVEPAVLLLPGLALDIDEPEDLQMLLEKGVQCPSVAFLREKGIAERLWTGTRREGAF